MTILKRFFAETKVASLNLNCNNSDSPVNFKPFGFEHQMKWDFIKITNCKMSSLPELSFAEMEARTIFFRNIQFDAGIKSSAFEVSSTILWFQSLDSSVSLCLRIQLLKICVSGHQKFQLFRPELVINWELAYLIFAIQENLLKLNKVLLNWFL